MQKEGPPSAETGRRAVYEVGRALSGECRYVPPQMRRTLRPGDRRCIMDTTKGGGQAAGSMLETCCQAEG